MSIIATLEHLYDMREEEIERWLAQKRAEAAPFVTTSVDLRHSGLRLAPVDTNLFPAGFNNLSAAARIRATRFFTRWLEDNAPQAKCALIVPENHTRNLAYLDNLHVIAGIVSASGLEVKIGSVAIEEPLSLTSLSGHAVEEVPLTRDGESFRTKDGFTPDFVLLNNDCTSGIPPLLDGIVQPVFPPPQMGWHRRRKSVHFAAYRHLAREFAEVFELDYWLISAYFHHAGQIDFKHQEGLDALAKAVDEVLKCAKKKHVQYGITEDPYVFVKADSGTYGMGIMAVRSGSEMMEMNKKERNKMQVVKEGAVVSEVIIQEGIPTVDLINEKTAEPMVYMIDGVPVGGMYRLNAGRDRFTNLNASGMEFTGMCDEDEKDCGRQPVQACNFKSYGLIAAMAALAAARERYNVTISMPMGLCA